jgi:predicted Fe-S protein YdhL (DUF1289 family)
MAIPSPCIDICAVDAATGWCAGCLRTLDEIAAWGALDDDDKRGVWKRLPARRAALARAASAAGSPADASAPAGDRREQDRS